MLCVRSIMTLLRRLVCNLSMRGGSSMGLKVVWGRLICRFDVRVPEANESVSISHTIWISQTLLERGVALLCFSAHTR